VIIKEGESTQEEEGIILEEWKVISLGEENIWVEEMRILEEEEKVTEVEVW
jgi:hypothetical protein